MTFEESRELLQRALESDDPSGDVFSLAVKLRDGGMKEEGMEKLFTEELAKHASQTEEKKWDAIADTLDFIVGWCSPQKRLFPGPTRVLVDWSVIRSEDELYDTIFSQCGSPSWHGRNINALGDSWVTGDINANGPPYAFRFLAASQAHRDLGEVRDAVHEIARDSVAKNGGTFSSEESEKSG